MISLLLVLPFAGDASAGEINVYQNVADTWTLYGNKIQGQADNDQFGTSLDMTPAGNILLLELLMLMQVKEMSIFINIIQLTVPGIK